MRVAITGGAGFLGQYLSQELSEAGYDVTVIDLRPARYPLVDLDGGKICRKISYGIDITNPDSLKGFFEGIHIVYHLAGIVSFARNQKTLIHNVNVTGTRNVLREAQRAKVPRFVHMSSVAAIGYNDSALHPANENLYFDWSSIHHKDYMESKHLAEQEVLQSVKNGSEMEVFIANPGLMWGRGDVVNSAKLIRNLFEQHVPAYPPGGTNIVDVRDVAHGLLAFLHHGRSGERYILGHQNINFHEIYDVICDELKVPRVHRSFPKALRPLLYGGTLLYELFSKQPQITADNIDSAFRFRYFDSTKAAQELGWHPSISFAKTISDSIQWLQKNNLLPLHR